MYDKSDGRARELREEAALAARELVNIAFRGQWPEILPRQPQWLRVVALAQAATGDATLGEQLAGQLLVCEHRDQLQERVLRPLGRRL